MPAIDAHHMRARLVSDLGTRHGRDLIGAFLESAANSSEARWAGMRGSIDLPYLTTVSASYLADEIKTSESFYITDDMMTLTEHAAQTMPNVAPLREELPAEAGFLWLPRPVGYPDIRGRLLNTRAFTWHQFRNRLAVTFWSDRDDPDDEVNQMIRSEHFRREHNRGVAWNEFPKLQMQHVMTIAWGELMPLQADTANLLKWRHLLGVEFVPSFADPEVGDDGVIVQIGWGMDPDVGTEENRVHARRLLIMNPPTQQTDGALNFLAVFFRLCAQTITTSERVPVDRASRRRTHNLPNNDAVTVINLRHHARPERPEGMSEIEWSHRWLRRGHWRRQWYGSGEHKYQAPVWIHETVCGPEDKPLVIRDHVTSLSR